MKSVKMETQRLLDIVKENKKVHEAAFEEALADYREAVNKVAEENVRIAKKNAKVAKEIDNQKVKFFNWLTYPVPPTSYADEYARAIRMLELEVDPTVQIDEQIFNQLVLDQWDWKHSFAAVSTSYKALIG